MNNKHQLNLDNSKINNSVTIIKEKKEDSKTIVKVDLSLINNKENSYRNQTLPIDEKKFKDSNEESNNKIGVNNTLLIKPSSSNVKSSKNQENKSREDKIKDNYDNKGKINYFTKTIY